MVKTDPVDRMAGGAAAGGGWLSTATKMVRGPPKDTKLPPKDVDTALSMVATDAGAWMGPVVWPSKDNAKVPPALSAERSRICTSSCVGVVVTDTEPPSAITDGSAFSSACTWPGVALTGSAWVVEPS